MARDYKHAKRSRNKSSGGTAAFFAGLGLGLVVAGGVHVYDKQIQARKDRLARIESETRDKQPPTPASQTDEPQQQLDFYEMLPKFEVVVPDKNKKGAKSSAPAAIDKPGSYILQAGSYRTFAEADRVRALLALRGVQARIEKAPIETETWHRVRIGPIHDLQKLEETRRKIREAQIDALVIRVPD